MRAIARAVCGALLVGAGLALGASPAWADACDVATITWDGGGGTSSWHVAANWDLNRVPQAGDHVCITNAAVVFSTGSTTVESMASSGALFTLSGGTLTVAGTSVSSSLQEFVLSAGTLTGAGTVVVQGAMTWSGGTMSGTGTTTIQPGTTLTLTGTIGRNLQTGRLLRNQGVVEWTGTGALNLGPDVIVDNLGTFNVAVDATMADVSSSGTDPVLVNTGTVRKTAGGGTGTISADLENDGLVHAEAGSITLGGGGHDVSSGTYQGPVTFSAAAHDLTGATVWAGTFANSTITVGAGAPLLVPAGGTLRLSSGTLTGDGTVQIEGAMTWTQGVMAGTGSTLIAEGATLDLPGVITKALQAGRVLDNQGTVTWGGAGSINAFSGARVVNSGLMHGDVFMQDASGAGDDAVLENTGVIRRDAGTASQVMSLDLDNDGLIEAVSGTLELTGGAGEHVSTGVFRGLVRLANNPLTVGGAVLDGIQISVSLVLVGDEPSVVPVGAVTQLSSGAVRGDGRFRVDGTLTWSGGSMRDAGVTEVSPTGVVDLPGAGTVILSERTIENAGTMRWLGSFGIDADTGATVVNSGLLRGNVALGDASGGTLRPRLVNTGTILKDTGASTTTIGMPIDNDGVVEVTSVGLNLSGGSADAASSGSFLGPVTLFGGVHRTSGASLSGTVVGAAELHAVGSQATVVPAGATLRLSQAGSRLAGTGVLAVSGTLEWNGGQMLEAGTTAILPGGLLSVGNSAGGATLGAGRALHNAGTVAFTGPNAISVGAGAVIHNTGLFEITGARLLSDGSAGGVRGLLVNTGTLRKLTAATTATLNIDVDNQGLLEVDAGTLSIGGTGALRNYSTSRQRLTGGVFELRGVLQFVNTGVVTTAAGIVLDGTSGAMRNSLGQSALTGLNRVTAAGSLELRGGASLSVSGALANEGVLSIGAGSTLTTTGAYTQAAGSTTLADTTSDLVAGGVGAQVTGGVLAGIGEIVGALTVSGGTVDPGTAPGTPGTLSVTGAYGQTAGGALRVDLGPTGHDQVVATGPAQLDGRLQLVSAAGFTPAVSTSFTLLTGASRTGAFASVDGAPLGGGTRYWLTPTATQVSAVVQPDSVADWGTVTVNGGAAATNTREVTLTLAVPAGQPVTGMRIANDAAPTGAFQAFAATTPWTLGPIDGTRAVHVEFRDDAGNASLVEVDTIVLDRVVAAPVIGAPATAGGQVVVTFHEDVTAVTSDNVIVRAEGAGAPLPGTLECLDAAGAPVACATGALRTVRFTPTTPFVPGVAYRATVNPAAAIVKITDLAGNAAPETSLVFVVPPPG